MSRRSSQPEQVKEQVQVPRQAGVAMYTSGTVYNHRQTNHNHHHKSIVRTGCFVMLDQSVFLYHGHSHITTQKDTSSTKAYIHDISAPIYTPIAYKTKTEHSRAHCACVCGCTPLAVAGAGVAGAGAGTGVAVAGSVGVGFGTLIVESGEPLLSFCFFVVVVIVSTLALINQALTQQTNKNKVECMQPSAQR